MIPQQERQDLEEALQESIEAYIQASKATRARATVSLLENESPGLTCEAILELNLAVLDTQLLFAKQMKAYLEAEMALPEAVNA